MKSNLYEPTKLPNVLLTQVGAILILLYQIWRGGILSPLAFSTTHFMLRHDILSSITKTCIVLHGKINFSIEL